jgi:MtaA/CmuA family methyltransferase
MDNCSPKERLSRTFQKKPVDRHPVICPGGMMNAAIVDIMNTTGHTLPDAHHDKQLMAALAADVHEYTGFENFGIPFCMTVEAEVLGSEIDFGTLGCEPKIGKERFESAADVEYKSIPQMLKSGRIETIAEAGYEISEKNSDVPVIGNLTGPISTAASIVDPMTFLKDLRKNPESSHKVLDYVTDFLIAYANILIENGVSVISVGDPTATGEILGPKMFGEYAVRYINKLVDGVHKAGVPIIVHICGNMNLAWNQIPLIKSDAISTDALVNLKKLKEEFPQLTTMGNLSTYLLQFGDSQKVETQTERLIHDGIDIISPACGLSTASALKNIQSMTQTVKAGNH